MKLVRLLFMLLFTMPVGLFAQIGPDPGSSINTWRVEQNYNLGQVVIRSGVVYQSLVNSNLHFDPAGSPSQWTTIIGSSSSPVTGTTALATSAITSGACQAVSAGVTNSSAATGATTASHILWTPAASLQGVTGYQVSTGGALSIDVYPTAGFVNFNVCNWTSGSVTPGAITINWEVL